MFAKKIFQIFCLSLVVIFLVGNVKAYETQVVPTPQKIYPGSPYYPLKRLWEKISAKFLFFDDAKVNNNRRLLETRFSELFYVVDQKLLDEIQRSSERFAYQAGIYTESVKGKNNADKGFTKQELKKYIDDLGKLRDEFSANSSYWMLVQHDINTIGILSAQLN